eukprot:m.83826 g.83826  ORF g.83826 m.83826 type:complete len:354 (+) comp36371_c0_seq6:16-1077(+)
MLNHLRRKGFVVLPSETACNAQLHRILYGHLGVLLKRNIFAEWWHSLVTSKPKTLAFETCGETGKEGGDSLQGLLLQLHNYQDVGSLPRKEFHGTSIAQTGICDSEGESISAGSVTFRARKLHQLNLHTFCAENEMKHWFQEEERARLQWWKKFSHNRGHFTVEETNDNCHVIQHGKLAVEKLTFRSATQVHRLAPATFSGAFDGLGCISMETSADQALLTFLCDAYEEISRFNTLGQLTDQKVLFLHPRLSPYKMAVTSLGRDENAHKLAGKLVDSLRLAGVSVAFDDGADNFSLDERCIRQDEVGTPFVAIVDDTTVRKGLARLRSRDTTQSELVEFDDVKVALRHYLKRR